MAFDRSLLNQGEEVVLDLRPHWFFLIEPVVAFAVIGLVTVGLLVWFNAAWLLAAGGLVLAVAAIWLLARYVRWININFVVTTDRVIFQEGVFAKNGIEIPLEKITNITSDQGIFERMIGAGDLLIESAGLGGQQHFTDIRRPANVKNEIFRQMESNDGRKYDQLADRIDASMARHAAQPAAAQSIPEQIHQLDELRQRGLLTDAEFQAKKEELLRRM